MGWSEDDARKLRGLPRPIRPGDVKPDELRAMVTWLHLHEKDRKSYPRARLYDREMGFPKQSILMVSGARVSASKPWVYGRLISNFERGELNWLLEGGVEIQESQDPMIGNEPQRPEPKREEGTTSSAHGKPGARRDAASHQGRKRIERLVTRMWVPEPESVPNFIDLRGPQFYALSIRGQTFRFEITTENRIVCWLDAKTEAWLLEDLMIRSPEGTTICEEWQSLQQAMDWYLGAADVYQFGVDQIGGVPSFAYVRGLRPWEATSETRYPEIAEIARARSIINTFAGLLGRVELMKDRLLDAQ